MLPSPETTDDLSSEVKAIWKKGDQDEDGGKGPKGIYLCFLA